MDHSNFYTLCQQNFNPEAIFIDQPSTGAQFTYDDLHKRSGQIANHLKKSGLKKGDRIIVQVEKSPHNLFWYFACLRMGLVYLPLNTAYLAHEIEYFVKDAAPSLILCDPAKASIFSQFTKCNIHSLDVNGVYSESMDIEYEFTDEECATDDIAVILYTSGTTGKPKGAMITHGNLVSNTLTLSEAWQWQANDIMLHALPIFHIHGLFVATHLPVMNSSRICFLEKFDPEKIIDLLPHATVYMGVPTHYVRLLANVKFNESICRNMRLFTSGSAPLLAQTFTEFQARTSKTIVERYGMTETGMNTSNPIDGQKKPGTVGLPLPGVDAIILNELEQAVAVNTPGILFVKGPNVFKGYWQMPDKTAEEFTALGYFKTGDIASFDEQGYISIIGRDKDMIITGGLNVYPKELEVIIDDFPGVKESAVIGLPHPDFGEAVTAIIVKEKDFEELNETAIISHLKSKVAGFKVTKQVFFIKDLPRNTMGKVQKNLLREQYKPD